MAKINAHEALQSEDCKTRNAAIVYLYTDGDCTIDYLHGVCDLAVSTIKKYVKKFSYLLDWARSIFYKIKRTVSKECDEFWCYIDRVTMPDGSIWCKIGQTTVTPHERAKGIKSKGWKFNGEVVKPVKIEVMKSFKCKSMTFMTNFEDCLRLGMTAIDPDGYEPNDRLNSWQDDYPERIMSNQFVKMGLEQFVM